MQKNPQKASASAVLALVAAAASLAATFTGHPLLGVFAAVLCLPLAVFGLVFGVSPRIGGGLISVVAVLVGALASLLALSSMIGVLTI